MFGSFLFSLTIVQLVPPFQFVVIDVSCHCQESQDAINRGFVVDSICLYMIAGVAMMRYTYVYLPDRVTKIWICFLTAVLTYVGDILDKEQDLMRCRYQAWRAYELFIFPSTLPLQEYIQSMPDIVIVINHAMVPYCLEEYSADFRPSTFVAFSNNVATSIVCVTSFRNFSM
ncbi:hypothetical protein DEU56DRAFT_754604 [Suillus clintonianus]|uniref:uncharacterized protein n=1 Tax=Suillus clintonianus TaxID=1904413 RepID=UPI001B86E73F|nr:uncharacterized protein DEU56DRAFT_754604 [Suillus clintonianus]KAG2143019.1 hypothetical protein DEU56DRAFT_754604 [Suillus clintonianus]